MKGFWIALGFVFIYVGYKLHEKNEKGQSYLAFIWGLAFIFGADQLAIPHDDF